MFLVSYLVNNKWVDLYSLNSASGPCYNLNKYTGEIFHDIQRRNNLKAGKCPIPPVSELLNVFLLEIFLLAKKLSSCCQIGSVDIDIR